MTKKFIMKNNIFGIFKKYYKDELFDKHLTHLSLFANHNDIPAFKNNFILNNQFNGIYKTKLNDHSYSIHYYDIKESDKTIIMFNYKSEKDYCISVKIDKSDPENVYIISIESLKQCYKTTDLSDIERKKGSILIQIIINWSKDNGYKKIYLDDISTYKCDTEHLKIYYNIAHVHTLTDGYPLYYKYGFRFVFHIENAKVKFNYDRLTNIKTSDIDFSKIINCITKFTIEEDKYKYFTDKETIINLHSLSNLYQKYYNDNIMKFFKKVSRNACIMMSLLWKYVFNELKLEQYTSYNMVLELK